VIVPGPGRGIDEGYGLQPVHIWNEERRASAPEGASFDEAVFPQGLKAQSIAGLRTAKARTLLNQGLR
jgi:hypothetical protein